MNSKLVVTVLAFFCLFQLSAQTKETEWKALEEFHAIMRDTYHPAKENNLTPVREKAAELVRQAELLATSSMPEKYNNKPMKKALKKLKSDCKKVDRLVKQQESDEKIKTALEKAHDSFHAIAEACRE
jgi:hypothetical protein